MAEVIRLKLVSSNLKISWIVIAPSESVCGEDPTPHVGYLVVVVPTGVIVFP